MLPKRSAISCAYATSVDSAPTPIWDMKGRTCTKCSDPDDPRQSSAARAAFSLAGPKAVPTTAHVGNALASGSTARTVRLPLLAAPSAVDRPQSLASAM